MGRCNSKSQPKTVDYSWDLESISKILPRCWSRKAFGIVVAFVQKIEFQNCELIKVSGDKIRLGGG